MFLNSIKCLKKIGKLKLLINWMLLFILISCHHQKCNDDETMALHAIFNDDFLIERCCGISSDAPPNYKKEFFLYTSGLSKK